MSTTHSFKEKGNYPVRLTASGVNGCNAQFEKEIFINSPEVYAGRDTVVLPDSKVPLNASGGVSYSWSPAMGLSNPFIQNPIATAGEDTRYMVTAATAEGCRDTASLKITVFKGSTIYVPNAFTPNGDGVNDLIKPYFIGIKSLFYFTIFDRWGKKVFSTNDMANGWNGAYKGKTPDTGAFAWVLRAEDLLGKVYFLKGSFTLVN